MAFNTQLSELTVNLQADAIAELLRGGFVDIMTGPQPRAADMPIEDQVVLAILNFSDPAFPPARSGVIIAENDVSGVGVADGDPAWFRAYRADHTTAVFDGSVSTIEGEKANMNLSPVKKISEGLPIYCRSFSHTVVKSTYGL